jgi:hypothetical protein
MFEKFSKLQIAFLGLILGLSIMFSASSISSNISKNEITVVGSASEIVKSDSAKWSINYRAEAPARSDAYNKLAKAAPVIKKFLTDNGIKENEIEFGNVSSYTTFKIGPTGNMTQEIKDHVFDQSVFVRSDNVELTKKLQIESQALVNQDIYITNSYVEYYYSKLPEKRVELLALATLDAKERAGGMLKATNNHVGKIRSVRMGVFQITQPESNDVSDWGINDTSTIDKKITAVANVVFGIR